MSETPYEEETNSTIDRRKRRKRLKCPICPPHRGENATRRPKHGAKKRKYKNKRRQ